MIGRWMNDLFLNFANWLEITKGRSAATSDMYVAYLVRLDDFLFNKCGGRSVLFAKASDLEFFCGVWAHQQGLSPRSRRPLIASVRGFYKWLYREDHIKYNPAKFLSYPKAGKPLPVVMGRNNAEALLKSCDLSTFVGVRDAAMLALLMATGLRISGLASLNQEQFTTTTDDEGNKIVLLRVLEKGKKERIIPVDEVAQLYLMIYLAHSELLALQGERLLKNGEHLLWVQIQQGVTPICDWVGEDRRLSAGAIGRMIVRRGLKLGIARKELHPHAIRHLFGTELAESDVPIQRIQLLMGHSDPKTTAIYIQLSGRKSAAVINAFSPLAKMVTPLHGVRDELKRRGKVGKIEEGSNDSEV